jgi:nucleoside-diphosphate-sugar epimerase
VEHFVLASSLGAYSPGVGPVDEQWPTTGIAASAYSRHKVAAELALDAWAASHPQITVTRVRPTVIAQPAAAAAISRYFLGPAVVTAAGVRVARLTGVLPWPRGLRLQLVHAADVADALVRILDAGAAGAFNLAAEPLEAEDVAAALRARHVVRMPAPLVRGMVRGLHAARAVPIDAGWVDLAMQGPLLDTSRARDELDWKPQHSSAQTLGLLLDALAARRHGDSPSLRP